jgi:DNA repair protein RAD5
LSRKSKRHPDKRYVGAFGVTGWATKSGVALLSYGETVRIERTRPSHGPAKYSKVRRLPPSKRVDIVVRFTNSRGEEVGRLENEAAAWVSTLLDQNICHLEGSCVFAPDRIRTSDTIYLQIRCFLLWSAFDTNEFVKLDSNREAGLFETQESTGERQLRLRQVALVRLFDEINLRPVKSDEELEKRKKEGLLQAAERAEQRRVEDSAQESKNSEIVENGGSSPPENEPEDGEVVQQDQLDALYKKAQTFDFNTPEADPPDTFMLNLRKYQKQALHWMLRKEKDIKNPEQQQSIHPLWDEYIWPTRDAEEKDLPEFEDHRSFYVNSYSGEMSLKFPVQEQNCLGGILADEMGLGKTIEMLSLMHSHRPPIAEWNSNGSMSVNDLTDVGSGTSQAQWAPATTLVVAPMSLLAQWQSEVERASKPGTLKCLVYYGNEKAVNLRGLCCEANASQAPNVIITSYGTVLSEYTQMTKGSFGAPSGGLFSLDYFRVILDEAHSIKNRLSKTSKACFGIKARHRWVLTGTPIVNRLEDLFSMVHFLKVEPWSNFSYWKTFITVPFEAKDFIRALDVVQTVLEPLVMRRTKDMKTPTGEALVPLPTRTINVEKIELSKNEREIYNCIFSRAKQTFQQREEAGTLLKSFTTIFAQILRLRQSCCHPLLTRNKEILAEEVDAATAADLAKGLSDDMDLDALLARFTADSEEQDANAFGANVLKQIQDEAEVECPICAEEPMNEQAVTACWHSACKKCLLGYIDNQEQKGLAPKCFNCREPIDSKDIFEVIRHDAFEISPAKKRIAGANQPAPSTPRVSLRRVGCNESAKISSLVGHLKQIRKEEPATKSVVFSQFTSFLDLIEPALKRDRIRYLRFDGSMAQKHRADVINDFISKKSGIVLLLSLRAGGVGLNLTAANRVYMMDPWWSFAVEAQAIDRVHRMGQEKEVVVTRFIVDESIEEKMLRIQDRKKFMCVITQYASHYLC